jgi:hypothetical protein
MQSMCPICRHSQRPSIDESLRAGRELRSLADEVGVDTRALRWHRDHVAGLAKARRRTPALR